MLMDGTGARGGQEGRGWGRGTVCARASDPLGSSVLRSARKPSGDLALLPETRHFQILSARVLLRGPPCQKARLLPSRIGSRS